MLSRERVLDLDIEPLADDEPPPPPKPAWRPHLAHPCRWVVGTVVVLALAGAYVGLTRATVRRLDADLADARAVDRAANDWRGQLQEEDVTYGDARAAALLRRLTGDHAAELERIAHRAGRRPALDPLGRRARAAVARSLHAEAAALRADARVQAA